MSARVLVAVLVLLVSGDGASMLRAQTPDTVRARIVQIAGADLHLELTAAPRLQPGDTLLLRRAGATRGALIVLAADSTRAVVGFAAERFALTRGELLAAELRRATSTTTPLRPAAPTPAPASAARPDSVSIRRAAAVAGPRASGYVTSDTRWIRRSDAAASESHGIPAATLSLRVTNLPAASSIDVFARAEYFANDAPPLTPGTTRLRVYGARLQSQLGGVRIGVGRLTSPHDAFGGPWDGVALVTGGRLSVAAEAGWEPEQFTAAPSTRFPRVGVSAQLLAGTAGTRYRGTIAALRYLEETPTDRGSLAVSTRHSVQLGRFSIWGDLLTEKTDSTSLALRWGGVHAAVSSAGGARFHAGVRRYQPYGFLDSDTTIAVATRARLEAGAYLPLGRASLNLNAVASPNDENQAMGANGHLFVRALPAQLDLDVFGGWWRRSDLTSISAGAGLGRTIGRVFTRGAYRLERGSEPEPVLAHEVEAEASLLVGRRSWISALGVHSTGGATSSTQLQLRLTWGF